jgi:hypothetical protein
VLPNDVLAALDVSSAYDVILRVDPTGEPGDLLAEASSGELPVALETARRLRERGARWAGPSQDDPLVA